MADEETGGPLFEHVVFTIIPSENFTEERTNFVLSNVGNNGGRYVPLRDSDQSIDEIQNITHIVSTHVDFPEYNRALELGIDVVKPSWVTACIRRKKQTSPRQHSPDPSQFFQDVILTTAGLPEGDDDAIKAGVLALGGQPSNSMTKLVTHLVTTTLDNQKCRLVREKELDCKIVLPHWFDACVKLGKKISEKPYLLPDPEILREDNGAIRPSPTPQLEGAVCARPTGEPPSSTPAPSPSKSRRFLNAFSGRKVFLAADLEISDHLEKTLGDLIESGGGAVTKDVAKCNIYIGQYRDGESYVTASRAQKDVANLAWLYHVINRNRYVSPSRKLLHYPIPRNGVPGFENMKISLSNYSGEARIYVENLIRYSGAEYTKTMKQDNTHLITAHMAGEKCEAAQEWNITVVNHLWLEESFAKCVIQTTSNPKYTTFPARTNLGEVTGQTCLDMKNVERYFFPKPKSPQKVKVQDKAAPRQTVPASSAIVSGPAASDAMDVDVNVPTPIKEGNEVDAEEEFEPKTVKRPRGRPRKSDAAATPRVVDEEKENHSPMPTSTGRAAKTKALNDLHTQSADIALYQREQKRKGGVIYGGRRGSRGDEQLSSPAPQSRSSRKRPSDEYEVTAQGSDLSDGETQKPGAKQSKKAKTSTTSNFPDVKFRMMVTGDDRWSDNIKKEDNDKKTLRQLGVALTQDPKDVDILVAPKLLRTKKFVCALAGAPLVVHTSFLDTALSKKKLIEDPPMLKDLEGEQRWGIKLVDALARAKVNKRQLFRGWSIFVSKDVKGGFDTYKEIIQLNGGNALQYAGRTGIIMAKARSPDDPEAGEESQNQGGNDEFGKVYLVSGDTDAEMKNWKAFRDTAKKQDLEPRIVHADWLLNAALSQHIEFKEKWELDEEKITSQRAG